MNKKQILSDENSNFSQTALIQLLTAMQAAVGQLPPPMTTLIIRTYGKDPYLILISCLLSLRSRDAVTYPVSVALFEQATTPQAMVALPRHTIEAIIKPIGFYKRKAMILQQVSQELIDRFNGQVPCDEQLLLSINHVGPKTAALVLGCACDIPAICVDTHVHRIANHLGLVHTTAPAATEAALKKIVPRDWWIRLNYLFVVWGQNVCKPRSKECQCKTLLPKSQP